MTISRSRLLLVSILPLLLIAAIACNNSDEPGVLATADRSGGDSLTVQLMVRDVEVGESRLPVVVLQSGEETVRLDDRLSDLSFLYRHADDEQFSLVPEVRWRQWPVRGGVYTGKADFDRPGIWEVQVTLETNGESTVGSTFINVQQNSSAPGVGDQAPITVTKTASTVEEVEQISSAFTPDPRFYSISLDEALTNGKPTVVLFSTPAFCVTQTCGPQLEVLGDLMEQHSGSIDFIHVEIFDNIREMLDTGDSTIGEVAQPVTDWNLVTEPWTFFVDPDGVIVARFEQFTTFEELSEATTKLLAAS